MKDQYLGPLWLVQCFVTPFSRIVNAEASFYFTGCILIRRNIYTVIFKWGSDQRLETKQRIEGKIVRFRSGRL